MSHWSFRAQEYNAVENQSTANIMSINVLLAKFKSYSVNVMKVLKFL